MGGAGKGPMGGGAHMAMGAGAGEACGGGGGSSSANVGPKNPGIHKTKLCERFMTTGNCPYGQKCTFAHGCVRARMRVAAAACFAGHSGACCREGLPRCCTSASCVTGATRPLIGLPCQPPSHC